MEKRSCIVIGAGLSGLAAAYALAKEGWKVTVLDARDRIGGRVFTHRFEGYKAASHLYCELDLIAGNNKTLRFAVSFGPIRARQ